MRFVKHYVPYRIYNNFRLKPQTVKYTTGNAFVLLDQTTDDSFNVINSNLFQNNLARAYYVDRELDRTVFRKRTILNRAELYKEVKQKTEVIKTVNVIGTLKKENVYIDQSRQLTEIMTSSYMTTKFVKAHAIESVIRSNITRLDNLKYEDIYFVIDSKAARLNYDNDMMKGTGVLSYVYLMFRKLVQEKQVFSSKANLYLVCYDDLTETGAVVNLKTGLDYNRLQRMFSLFHKISSGAVLTPEESLDVGDEIVDSTPSTTVLSDERDMVRKSNFYISQDNDMMAVDSTQKLFVSPADAFCDFMVSNQKASFDNNAKILFVNDVAPWTSLKKIKMFSLAETDHVSLVANGKVATVSNPSKLSDLGKVTIVPSETDKTVCQITFKGDNIGVTVQTNRLQYNDQVLNSSRGIIYKLLKVDPKIVPLNVEEVQLIDAAINNIEDYLKENIATVEEVAQYIKTSGDVTKMISKLVEYRYSSLEHVRHKEKIKALKDREESAEILDTGTETTEKLANRIKTFRDGTFEPKKFPIEGRIPEIMKQSSTLGFRETYLREQYETDVFKIFTSFSDSDDIPIFIDTIKKTDISSQRDKKDLYEIKYSMPNGKPQTMRVEIPKLSSEGYLYLNGARKQISNQIIPLPIIKIMSSGIDAVQYTTNYNKIFVERTNGNLNSSILAFSQAVNANRELAKGTNYDIILGNASTSNSGMVNSLEYDEFSKFVNIFKAGQTVVHFTRNGAKECVEKLAGSDTLENSIDMSKFFVIGKKGSRVLVSELFGSVYSCTVAGEDLKEEATSLFQFIKEELAAVNAPFLSKMKERPQDKKYVYTTVKVANLKMPLISFLGYKVGVEKVMEQYGVNYEFVMSDQVPSDSSMNESIAFQDGKLYFNNTNVSHSILVNGLRAMDPSEYDFAEFGPKGEAFQYWFMAQGKPQHGKALGNFYVLFIDHITKEVLDGLEIPSDIVGSFLYCNTLLNNPSYSSKNDISQYRVRSHEFIAANLYQILGRNIENFRRLGQASGSTASLSIRSDELIKAILESPLCADATLLNPIKQCMDLSQTTLKGKGGYPFNSSKGTEDFRVYDESMKGILGMVTPDNAQVGITRKLSLNSSIRNRRGMFAIQDSSQINAANLLQIGELCSTFTATSADGPRVGMQTTQSGHQLPTNDMQRCLVTSGAQKVIPFFAGNEFAFKAFEDGVIKSVDKENELVNLEYSDGTRGVIDYSIKNVRAPDGFYTGIELEGDFQVGKRFKKGDILGADKRFFKVDGNNTELKHGTLTKIAIACHDSTYEDSQVITETLARRMASTIIMQKAVNLGPKTNVQSMLQVGDRVETGRALMIFEESFADDDGSLADLLSRLGDEFNEEISEVGRNASTSSYTGEIVDMRVHYNRPLEEYSPSIQKIITDYTNKYSKRAEVMKGVREDQIVDYRSTERNETGKGGGTLFDGIVVEYYIRTIDTFKVGDKLVFSKALKSITAEIIPTNSYYNGDYIIPYGTEDGEEIHAFLSPMSLVSRMTCDVYRELSCNTVLVGLKRRIADIMGSNCNIAGTIYNPAGKQVFPVKTKIDREDKRKFM